jgi:TetR/AcrR family transcriptional regulator, repressor for neighboring sulfatase
MTMSETSDAVASDRGGARPRGRDSVIDAAISAAADLFAEKSPRKVSVREIAARAGVSHALVHRYLGSKEEILVKVLEFDREEARKCPECTDGAAAALAPGMPAARYLQTIMRASLDGMPLPEGLQLPHAEPMMQSLRGDKTSDATSSQSRFDTQVLFSAVTAMTASMGIAEDIFLAQSGLEDCDRARVRDVVNRLVTRIMTLDGPTAGMA